MKEPLAIDLCCGLGGWTEGLIAEGYRVVGYDIEAHEYGEEKYPGELRLENVLTLNGAQFKDAALIVASPPCQEFSYMAMPWSRAKAKAAAIRADETGAALAKLTALFDACFRIQHEACAAAGRHIPLVVENVKGAQPWVGRAKWSFGSYFLWGDVPALMPIQKYHQRQKVRAGEQWNINRPNFTGTLGWDEGLKAPGGSPRRDGAPHTARLTSPAEGRKGGSWFEENDGPWRQGNSKSPKRKAASAKIAKIPFALSSWIARTYKPSAERAA